MITVEAAVSKNVREEVPALVEVAQLDTTSDLLLCQTFMERHAVFKISWYKQR